jgi:hypothetical protein
MILKPDYMQALTIQFVFSAKSLFKNKETGLN